MKRRFLCATGAGLLGLGALRSSLSRGADSESAPLELSVGGAAKSHEKQWFELDRTISTWWDKNLTYATEKQIRSANGKDLLFLPFPYIGPTGSDGIFGYMFAWDTPDFTTRALMAHERADLARNHLLNYLAMIERFGYMPNANSCDMATRSQTPLIADTLWRYFLKTRDIDVLYRAYSLLKLNYQEYWNGKHHQTPIGLSTNRDLGDITLPPELASEAETGLDWTPIFAGDVRRCVPLITNCALVKYARVLSWMAKEIGRFDEHEHFSADSGRRAALIRRYCWDEPDGLFREYDYVARKRLPYISECSYWTLWAGVATHGQARQLVSNLHLLEQAHGLSCTDKAYPAPLPAWAYEPKGADGSSGQAFVAPDIPKEEVGGQGELQWMYPAGWPSTHLIIVEGLDAYGYSQHAERIAGKYLSLVLDQYQRTGKLWEKYNAVDGSLVLPNSRYGVVPYLGWTAAAVVLLGRRLFAGKSLTSI